VTHPHDRAGVAGGGGALRAHLPSRPERPRVARRGRPLALALLVAALAAVLAVLVPGVAGAAGEQLVGTLQTARSGPIQGVKVTVTTAAGAPVGTGTTGADGRWTVDLPGPGQYTASINAGDLPKGVQLAGESKRTVTVDNGRRQPVNIALSDGSSNTGGGTIRAVQLLVDGLRFGLLIAMCAIGLSLIFGTTGLTNFAHGELVTIGAIIAWYINVNAGVPLIIATLIAMVGGAAVGALTFWRRRRDEP
jgi:branched-chain amino acid transport system permease protein